MKWFICFEIWGFNNADSIERAHKKFCKYVLNVKISTNYFAMYGELGRFSTYHRETYKLLNTFFEITPD